MKRQILFLCVILLSFYTYAQNNVYGKKVVALDSVVTDTIKSLNNASVWVQGLSAGGVDTQIQYNDNGAFNGATGFVFNDATNDVSITSGDLTVGSNALSYINIDGGTTGAADGNLRFTENGTATWTLIDDVSAVQLRLYNETQAENAIAFDEATSNVIIPNGTLNLNQYGSGTNSGVSTYFLTVTSSGLVVEEKFTTTTYTPTVTQITNMDSNSDVEATYHVSGDWVTVNFFINANPTSSATLTQFDITLPVSSNLVTNTDVGGAGTVYDTSNRESVMFSPDTTDDEVRVSFFSIATANNFITGSFSYRVN